MLNLGELSYVSIYTLGMQKRQSLKRVLAITIFVIVLIGNIPATWQKITTEHFIFIFEDENLHYVRQLASTAESLYSTLSELLDNHPKTSIPVIIGTQSADAYGYYTSAPSSVFLSLTSPATRFLGQRSSDWLSSVFVHELTHYLHLTSKKGLFGTLSYVFGPDIAVIPSSFMSGWWVEGITTYAETAFVEGGRGEDRLFELEFKAPIVNNSMWSLWQGSYQSSYPPSGRIYSTGYVMVAYLMDTYGTSVFEEINHKFLRFPFLGLSFPIRKTTGLTAKDIFASAQSRLKASFPQVEPLIGVTAFSPVKTGHFYLPLHTEMGWIGYATTPETGSAIVRYADDGSTFEVLKRMVLSDEFSFDSIQDGSLWAIATPWEKTIKTDGTRKVPVTYSDVFLYDYDADTFTRLTWKQQLLQPTIDQSASYIAAIEPLGTQYRLVIVDVDNPDVPRVLYEPTDASVYEPQFMPDGNHIVAIEVSDGLATLVVIAMDGSAQHLWPHGEGAIHRLRCTDGSHITFSADTSGSLSVYSYNLIDKTISLIIEDPVGAIGAEINDDTIIYGTYGPDGFSLKKTSLGAIKSEPVRFKSDIKNPDLPEITKFQPVAYRDWLRFGFWLPTPIDDTTTYTAGITALFHSPLGKHTVLATGGWSFTDNLPITQLEYVYDAGWGVLQTNVEVNTSLFIEEARTWYRAHTATSALSFVFAHWPRPDRFTTLKATPAIQFTTTGATSSFIAAYGMQLSRGDYGSSRAFFGRSSTSVAIGMNAIFNSSGNLFEFRPTLYAARQFALGNSGHAISVEIATIATTGQVLQTYTLAPKGNVFEPRDSGKIKSTGTIGWHIPLGLYDIPIPYGGLTAIGARLFAQTSAYYNPGEFSWEKDVYLGGELHIKLAFGSNAIARPYIGFMTRISDRASRIYFNLGFPNTSIISSRDETGQFGIIPVYALSL